MTYEWLETSKKDHRQIWVLAAQVGALWFEIAPSLFDRRLSGHVKRTFDQEVVI